MKVALGSCVLWVRETNVSVFVVTKKLNFGTKSKFQDTLFHDYKVSDCTPKVVRKIECFAPCFSSKEVPFRFVSVTKHPKCLVSPKMPRACYQSSLPTLECIKSFFGGAQT